MNQKITGICLLLTLFSYITLQGQLVVPGTPSGFYTDSVLLHPCPPFERASPFEKPFLLSCQFFLWLVSSLSFFLGGIGTITTWTGDTRGGRTRPVSSECVMINAPNNRVDTPQEVPHTSFCFPSVSWNLIKSEKNNYAHVAGRIACAVSIAVS